MDNQGWLTPSIAEILLQGPPPPAGDGTIRDQALELQQALSNKNTPARIVNVRLTPSYTMFVAQPESIGRIGNRQNITPEDLRRSLNELNDERDDWTLGIIPNLQDEEGTVGILLRTERHNPLSLRRVIVQNRFRDHPSTVALPLGSTLQQRLMLYDLAEIQHLIIIGEGEAKAHLIRGLLLTLILMNTPSELRFALIGENSPAYEQFVDAPHALGHTLTSAEEAQRLLDGLVNEIQRRVQLFRDREVSSINEYNLSIGDADIKPIPRIILVADTLSADEWAQNRDRWLAPIYDLLMNGAIVGIHLIMTANQLQEPDTPEIIRNSISTGVVLRSRAIGALGNLIRPYQGSIRFVDGFIFERDKPPRVTPVELYAIAEEEIDQTISYWQRAAKQRAENQRVSEDLDLSSLFHPAEETADNDDAPAPPVPQRPKADALVRATTSLGGLPATQNVVRHAEALAAYLGWLGVGPLIDILGISHEQAESIIETLQASGVLESDESATPRFVRLSDNPFEEFMDG